jgi:hypothetical protein
VTAPKKPINSRAKGKRGELQFAKALAELGHPAARGQQRKGGEDSPDVICPSLPWVHWEVKLMASCKMFSPATVADWEAQATRDSGTRHPVLAHRWNGARQWWVRVWTSGRGPYWQALPDFIANLPPVLERGKA